MYRGKLTASESQKGLDTSMENLGTVDSITGGDEIQERVFKGVNPDTAKRITQLKSYIAVEEKFAQGAQAILKASTTDNQKLTASNQLDNFKKNIGEWQKELDQLTQAVEVGDDDPLNSSQVFFDI